MANDALAIFHIFEFVEEFFSTGKSNLVNVFSNLIRAHSDTLVRYREGVILFVQGYFD